MNIYSETSPNTEHIRAVAEDIAARLSGQCGAAVAAETLEFCSNITLPCRDRLFINISEVDAGSLPLNADIFFGDGFKQIYSVDYKSEDEFAEAVCGFVKGLFLRQLRVTRTSRLFGGVSTRIECLENGEWALQSEGTDKSFIMRLFTWKSKTTVSEYDFRMI